MNMEVLKTDRPDAEKATEYKKQVADALRSVCLFLDAARADGLTVEFNLGINAFGRSDVAMLKVYKIL